jgi:hypothetical protein
MHSSISSALLVVLLFSCAPSKERKASAFPDDPKLSSTWQSFKKGLNNADTAVLKELSLECIHTREADTAITSEQFYNLHFNRVFDSVLLSYINDANSVSAGYPGYDLRRSLPCLAAMPHPEAPGQACIMIAIPVEGQEEGVSVVLDFIEINGSYKFCGYFTIP